MSDTILAVDFGTSHSLAGAFHEGRVTESLAIDPVAADQTLMRTLLFFPSQDECFYGADAIREYVDSGMEGRLFRSFKTHLPNKNYLGTVIDNRILTLENMIGYFLLELRKRAEKLLGTKIHRAVMGRPARYAMDPVADGLALHRMKKACDLAGFTQVQFVPEPLAAAFDYRRELASEKLILVGDFGGGTSDFSLVRLRPGEFSREDVLSIEGCALAGDALDSLFMSQKLNVYFGAKSRYRLPMSNNVLTMPPGVTQRLNLPAHIVHLRDKDTYEFIREVSKCALGLTDKQAINRLFALIEDQQIFPFFEEIEAVKRELSRTDEAPFNFDYPGIEITEQFSAAQFFGWSSDAREQIFAALDRCLLQAGVAPGDIDLVCLTGGTAKVPFIRAELEQRFGVEKLRTREAFHSVITGLTETAALWARGQNVV